MLLHDSLAEEERLKHVSPISKARFLADPHLWQEVEIVLVLRFQMSCISLYLHFALTICRRYSYFGRSCPNFR